jgi:hypothetical protein
MNFDNLIVSKSLMSSFLLLVNGRSLFEFLDI